MGSGDGACVQWMDIVLGVSHSLLARHEEIRRCVAASRGSALHSSRTGNYMSPLQVYHGKPLLLQLFKSLPYKSKTNVIFKV